MDIYFVEHLWTIASGRRKTSRKSEDVSHVVCEKSAKENKEKDVIKKAW